MNFELKKRVLFIDRDGVIVNETQVDDYGKIVYIPHVFEALRTIRRETDFELVLVSNQDGVGTPSYPRDSFRLMHQRIIETLRGEDIAFDEEFIDFSLPSDNCPGRKPGIAMIEGYTGENYDLGNSFMIGDRLTDMELARRKGVKGIWLSDSDEDVPENLNGVIALKTMSWLDAASFLTVGKSFTHRTSHIERNTKETQISLSVDLDGTGDGSLKTGIGFFDHMLEQVVKHSRCSIVGVVHGDLEVDEHHTVEDLALALGKAFLLALGDKRGINRYGSDMMMMDEVVAKCAIDFSGRPECIFIVPFKREEVGGFPTELFRHFFKSFSDEAKCNLYIEVTDGNAHHQAEAAFKSFARALRMAVKRIPGSDELMSTKGVL